MYTYTWIPIYTYIYIRLYVMFVYVCIQKYTNIVKSVFVNNSYVFSICLNK